MRAGEAKEGGIVPKQRTPDQMIDVAVLCEPLLIPSLPLEVCKLSLQCASTTLSVDSIVLEMFHILEGLAVLEIEVIVPALVMVKSVGLNPLG